jgi:hypothetical protein
MTHPITRQNPTSSSTLDDPTPAFSTLPQEPLQEMLDIMHRLEQRIDDTDKCLALLEAPSASDPIPLVTPQDINDILT